MPCAFYRHFDKDAYSRIRLLNDDFRSTFVGGQRGHDARGRRASPRRQGSPHPRGSVLQQFHERTMTRMASTTSAA